MRLLLTGASGFLGRHLLAVLQKQDWEVATLSRGLVAPATGVWHVPCDMLDCEATKDIVKWLRPTHVVHLAWTSETDYWTAKDNLRWLNASLNLMQAFAENGGQRFVGVGTCVEYAPVSTARKENETPTRPDTLYGKAKLACGNNLAAMADGYDFSFAWCRPFYILGPGEKPGRLIPSAWAAFAEGRTFRTAAWRRTLDYMDVRDAARALGLIVKSDISGFVNIASGNPVRVGDLLHTLGTAIGRPDFFQVSREDQGKEQEDIVADITRLRLEAQFQPEFSLEQSIEDYLAQTRQQGAG